jgi:uncharacterized membrane protein
MTIAIEQKESLASSSKPAALMVTRLPGVTTAALTSIGAGVVHAGAIGIHAEHPTLARLFIAVACFQLGWGLVALFKPARWFAVVGAVGNLAAAGAWLMTRLTGISFVDGLEVREAAQFTDTTCALLGIVAAGLALSAALIGWRSARPGQFSLPSLLVAALVVPALVTGSDHVHTHSATTESTAGSGVADHVHSDSAALAVAPTGSAVVVAPVDESVAHDHSHTDSAAAIQPTIASDTPSAAAAGTAAAPTATDGSAANDATHDHEAAPPTAALDDTALDDKGLSLIMNGHQHAHVVQPMDSPTTAMLAEQLARTAELVALYPTVAAAEAAGYRRQGPYSPGLGTHYGKGAATLVGATITDDNVLNPMLIFDGTAPESKLAGFMYIAFGVAGEPEGFAGPNDIWHSHKNICIVMNPDGSTDTPLGADKDNVPKELCDSYGGFLLENSGYMLHVWTVPGYESSKGVFNEVNPALACADGTYYTKPIEELGTSLTLCANE